MFPATTFGRLLSSNSHNTLTAIGEGVGWGATSTDTLVQFFVVLTASDNEVKLRWGNVADDLKRPF